MSGSGAPPGRPAVRVTQSAGPPPEMPEVTRLLQQAVHGRMFSAVACLSARQGITLHASAHGAPKMPPPATSVPPDCLFDLGELTGSLSVSLAVAYLVGRGRLDLNMPLVRALPDAEGTAFAEIPLDMLLDHTSGLALAEDLVGPLVEADRRRIGDDRVLGTRRAAPELWTQLRTQLRREPPGAQPFYNPLNTHLMSLAIASLVQKPFDVWLQKELFVALNLTDALHYVESPAKHGQTTKRVYAASGVCPIRKRSLQGEVFDAVAWALGGAAGHAGLFGNTAGVFRVLETLRTGAKAQHRMLHAGTLVRLWTRLRRTQALPWALGWQSMTKQGRLGQGRWHPTAIGQLDVATGAAYLIDPAGGQVCVLLSNRRQAPKALDANQADEAWLKLCRRVFDLFVTAK